MAMWSLNILQIDLIDIFEYVNKYIPAQLKHMQVKPSKMFQFGLWASETVV